MLPVADKGIGSFTQMAAILDCGSLIDRKPDGSPAARVTVGEIWRTLPESLGFPLDTVVEFPVLGLEDNDLLNLPYGAPWEPATLEGVPGSVKQAATPDALKDFLAHYPDAGAWTSPFEALGIGQDAIWFPGEIHSELNRVALLWPPKTGPTPQKEIVERVPPRVGAVYFSSTYLFPALGDNTRPMHPLLAWWAVLYALSMVARYEPRAWNEMTSINTSIEASPIEHILQTAIIRLPRLMLDVIDRLNH